MASRRVMFNMSVFSPFTPKPISNTFHIGDAAPGFKRPKQPKPRGNSPNGETDLAAELLAREDWERVATEAYLEGFGKPTRKVGKSFETMADKYRELGKYESEDEARDALEPVEDLRDVVRAGRDHVLARYFQEGRAKLVDGEVRMSAQAAHDLAYEVGNSFHLAKSGGGFAEDALVELPEDEETNLRSLTAIITEHQRKAGRRW
jgi:hypothetical protein